MGEVESQKVLKLSDEVIAHIAKVLQLAMLSGTDVVDHFRSINLVASDNFLFLDESTKDATEKTIADLLKTVGDKQGA